MVDRDDGWGGVVSVGPWWLLYTGVYGPTARHAHHAAQVVAADDEVSVCFDGDLRMQGRALVIPPDVPHALESSGVATMVFIDAESSTGRRLAERHAGVPERIVAAISATRDGDVRDVVEAVLCAVDETGPATGNPLSAAIAAVVAQLADDPDAGTAVEFAAQAELSPSRFSQRFAREVGIPLRSYRRWVRMLLAVEALNAGASLTAAAHTAGFTDSAHLSRTFRDSFGIAPTDLLAASRFEPLR